jgi:hypothetical protein
MPEFVKKQLSEKGAAYSSSSSTLCSSFAAPKPKLAPKIAAIPKKRVSEGDKPDQAPYDFSFFFFFLTYLFGFDGALSVTKALDHSTGRSEFG